MKGVFGILVALFLPVAGWLMTDAPAVWPVSVLLYNLGLLYGFAVVPRKGTRMLAYNIIAAIFFVIESSFFFSFYLQNAGFNDAFFYHLRFDLLYAGIKQYLPILLVVLACLCGHLLLSSFVLTRVRGKRAWLIPVALCLLVFGLFISPPAKALVRYIVSSSAGESNSAVFENFRELLGPKVAVTFEKAKRPNVVLIYAESLEQRFFDQTMFPSLLPNLSKIKENSIDFTNVSQGPGAGWTVGGIVASQCGYPLAGSQGVKDNDLSIFDQFLPKATCLGDLLKQDGYRLTFIGGADGRFAGKQDFLRSHGYEKVFDREELEKTLVDQSYVNSWGVFDDTMFDFAIQKFLALSSDSTPFLLTLLTLDTHDYNGYLSKSCGPYGSGENSSLNAFHCTDKLVSGFIEQIRNTPYSDETIIIVLSDHLALRNKASSLLEASQKQSRLTFFVNVPNGKKEENNNPGVHYDIGPTILDLVGYDIREQIGFGAPLTRGPGYLPGKFGVDGWNKQAANLMAIAGTLWDNNVALDENGIQFSDFDFSFTMGGREFDLHSKGFGDVPGSTIFIFDNQKLKLEKIITYGFDIGMTGETLGKALLQHKEKLALVIGRARNLPGFTDPRNHPEQWVFFCGRPGSDYFSWGPITGDFLIPFDLIQKFSNSKIDERVVRERENILKNVNRES